MIVVKNVCKTNKWSWHRSCLSVETFIDDNKNDDDDEHSKVTSSKIKRRTKARIIRSVWFNKEAEPEKDYREFKCSLHQGETKKLTYLECALVIKNDTCCYINLCNQWTVKTICCM